MKSVDESVEENAEAEVKVEKKESSSGEYGGSRFVFVEGVSRDANLEVLNRTFGRTSLALSLLL